MSERVVFFLLALSFFLGTRLPAQTQVQPDPHYIKGVELQRAGKLDEAVTEYEAALKTGARLEVLGNLGAVLAQLGRYEAAIARYEEALKLAPKHPMILFNLALAHYKSGDLTRAAEIFEALSISDTKNRRAAILLADCRFQLGQYKRAIELLDPIYHGDPDDLGVVYLLGNAYLRDHQPDKGQPLLEKILRNGESAEAHLMMATALSGVFRNKEAIVEYEKAIQLNPKLPMAHVGVATEYLRQSDPDRALKEYRAELEINPNDYTAHFYIGYLARTNGDYNQATESLQRALALRPGDAAAMLQLGLVYFLHGDLDKAQGLLETAARNEPEFIDAYLHLARVYFRKGMVAQGRQAQKTADELKLKRESARKAAGYDPDRIPSSDVPLEGGDRRP